MFEGGISRKQVRTVPLKPFCLPLKLVKFHNNIRMDIIMDNLHLSSHPQISFDVTYKTTMGNEYLLFKLRSNGKQNSGKEYHRNQTLAVAV